MKIIFTVTNDLTFDNRMMRICGALSTHGYEVMLVGRKLKGSKPLKEEFYKQYRLPCFFTKGKLFYAEFNIRLFFYLLFCKADAICSIDLDTILPGFLVSLIRSKKFVYDAHEYFTQVPEVINRRGVQAFWEAVEGFVLPKIKNAYTVNESIARLFESKYKTHFEVIYNAPRFEEREDVNNFSKRILLYQGALNASRGLEQLIEAMKEIDAELWLVGEGDLSQPLRRMVKELGLENKVTFKGMVPPQELAAYTREASIGINVSENAGLSYYYSLNNKFFDYIHAGLPSVTNDFPEYRTIMEKFETGILSTCEVKILVKDIILLLNDEELYRKFKQNCLIASRYYCWQSVERRLLDFYAGLQ